MKKSLIIIAALMFAAVSCQEKLTPAVVSESNADVQLVPASFDVVFSKTALSGDSSTGLAVEWKAGDKIGIFDNVDPSVIHEFVTANGGANATFTGSVAAGATAFNAVYPYTDTTTISSGKISAVIPATQSAEAGQADPQAMYAVASTTGSTLEFKQVGALMSFTFDPADSVTSFYVEGKKLEKIAGAAEITVADAPTTSVSGESRITVIPADGEIFNGTYYVCIPPVNFTEGFRVVLRSASHVLSMSRTTDKALNVTRKSVTKFGDLAKDHKWNGIEYPEQLRSFLDKNTKIGESFVAGDVVELLSDVALTDGSKRDGLDYAFAAIFEGNNHTVHIEYAGAPSCNALFKNSNGATFRNINLTGYRTTNNRNAKDHTLASLVAKPTNTTIINCHSTMNLTYNYSDSEVKESGNALVGGLVSYVYDNFTIKDCSFDGNIEFNTGTQGYGCLMGGIAGFIKASSNGEKRIIDNCSVKGNVVLNQNYTSAWCMFGGVAAQNKMNVKEFTSKDQAALTSITNFTNSMNVTVKGATKSRVSGVLANPQGAYYMEKVKFDGSISYESTNSGGEHLAGGLLAYSEITVSGYMTNCTFAGSISNDSGSDAVKYWLGGVVGNGMLASTVVDGCIVTPSAVIKRTKGLDDETTSSAGLVGGRPNTAITIKNCKVAGYINDKTKGEVTITSQEVLDANQWVIKGSKTSAAVTLENNVYYSGN